MANKNYDLAHTKWMCKYHIVFTPKYRRKVIYNRLKADIRDEEFVEYLQKNKSPEFLEAMTGAEEIIDYLAGQPEKEHLREIVTDAMI